MFWKIFGFLVWSTLIIFDKRTRVGFLITVGFFLCIAFLKYVAEMILEIKKFLFGEGR